MPYPSTARSGARRAGLLPLTLTGCALWLSARRGLYQDVAGATRIQGDTDPVARWEDWSGNNAHLTQAILAARPLYRTGVLGGQPAVRFDSVDDFLSGTLVNLPTAYTLFVVASSSASGTDLGIWRLATNSTMHGLTHHIGTTAYAYYTGGGSNINSALALNTPRILVSTYSGGSTSGAMNFYQNGIIATNKSGLPSLTNLSTEVAVGERAAGVGYFGGDIAEVLLYSRILPIPDFNRVGEYLSWEYAQTWTTLVG